MTKKAIIKALRENHLSNAIVFIHGFGGNPVLMIAHMDPFDDRLTKGARR